MRAHLYLFLALLLGVFASCKQEVEKPNFETYQDYLPLQPGKYITYRLDSVVFTKSGAAEEKHSYQEKHLVDAQFTDNSGRTSYKIYRFIRDTAGLTPWVSAGTYFITPTENTVEVVENNLRVLKLITPVTEGNTWKGNRYLPNNPFKSSYDFSDQNKISVEGWDFSVDKVNEVVALNNKTYNGVATVLQIDEKNVIDTIKISSNNLSVPVDKDLSFWITGTASDTVRVNAGAISDTSKRLFLYNATNFPITLNKISIPKNFSRNFQCLNGQWTYPVQKQRIQDSQGIRDTLIVKDTLYNEALYGSKAYAVDKYAKQIGLIYQELILWEFQPNTSGGAPYKVGFEVKRSVIDHN